MASQTENQIHALALEMTILRERVETLRGETQPLSALTQQIAVIEHRLSEMTKTKELWGQRGWMILTICLSALFSFVAGILGALLTFYLNTKKYAHPMELPLAKPTLSLRELLLESGIPPLSYYPLSRSIR